LLVKQIGPFDVDGIVISWATFAILDSYVELSFNVVATVSIVESYVETIGEAIGNSESRFLFFKSLFSALSLFFSLMNHIDRE
jgi:hypothetical protein